jgi:hypothetical protein
LIGIVWIRRGRRAALSLLQGAKAASGADMPARAGAIPAPASTSSLSPCTFDPSGETSHSEPPVGLGGESADSSTPSSPDPHAADPNGHEAGTTPATTALPSEPFRYGNPW